MKKIILGVCFAILLFNCSQDSDAPFFEEVVKESDSSLKVILFLVFILLLALL